MPFHEPASPRRTLAIIPALNEEQALPSVIESLRAAPQSFDILIVDDGSTDGTARVAREAGVTVASLPFNLGIGAALRTGFRYAVERDYDAAFQFDADGQHEVAALGELLAPLDDGVDLVVGSRFLSADGCSYRVGRTRTIAMRLLRFYLLALTKRRFTDTSSGFRAFSAPMIREFARSYPREYMDSVEALVNATRCGYAVCEVGTRMSPRAAGEPSNRSFRLAYNYLRLLLVLVVGAGRRASAPSQAER